jgi:hypothetical protein
MVILYKPKGERPNHPKNQGPDKEEKRPNPNQIIISPRNTTMGWVTTITRSDPPKMGLIQPSHGVATPPLAPFGPNLVSGRLPPCPMSIWWYGPGSMYLEGDLGSVCFFHMGVKHISKDPLLSPIKGGSVLLIWENTQEKSTQARATPLNGIRP